MSYHYSICGLQLAADRELPGLTAVAAVSQPDVRLYWQKESPQLIARLSTLRVWHVTTEHEINDDPELVIEKTSDGSFYCLRYVNGANFILDAQGTEIWIRYAAPLTMADVLAYLFCPVMSFVLYLRGVVCLHASAIAVEGQTFALIGQSGAGKSTTAAMFAQMGFSILSDDLLALCERDGAFCAQPSYPQIHLRTESVPLLYGAETNLPQLAPTWDKRRLDLQQPQQQSFQNQALPLSAIYLLSERVADPAAPFIKPLAATEGLLTLLADTFSAGLPDKNVRAREFNTLSRLIQQIPLRRAIPHQDATRLPALCRAILDDFCTFRQPAIASQVACP